MKSCRHDLTVTAAGTSTEESHSKSPKQTSVPRLDKTSQAAVDYLTTKSSDALDHLIAICWRAKGGLFIVAADETGPSGKYFSTRSWILGFLAGELSPYQEVAPEQILEAARQGKFRYIGRTCRLRMVDDIRRFTAKKRLKPFEWSLEYPIGNGDDLNTFASLIGVEAEDSFAGRSVLGHRPVPEELEMALLLWRNRYKFEEKLGGKVFITLKAICGSYLKGEIRKGQITKAISQRCGVKEWQARAYKRALNQKMLKAIQAGDTAAAELYDMLVAQEHRIAYVASNNGRVKPSGHGSDG
jgi:hypothetical protein